MQVRDVMTDAPVTDSAADTLRSAAERMWRQQTGSLLVMESDRLAGIITERDLLRAVARGEDPATTSVEKVMTTVFTIDRWTVPSPNCTVETVVAAPCNS